MLGKIYAIMVTVILLFPWSVVGALWERGKGGARSSSEDEKARTPGMHPGGSWLKKRK
ncbi:MAG: hypothetical protein V3W10_09655 [candidate division NC10 bacterium]|jgi:hypothetical protein